MAERNTAGAVEEFARRLWETMERLDPWGESWDDIEERERIVWREAVRKLASERPDLFGAAVVADAAGLKATDGPCPVPSG